MLSLILLLLLLECNLTSFVFYCHELPSLTSWLVGFLDQLIAVNVNVLLSTVLSTVIFLVKSSIEVTRGIRYYYWTIYQARMKEAALTRKFLHESIPGTFHALSISCLRDM